MCNVTFHELHAYDTELQLLYKFFAAYPHRCRSLLSCPSSLFGKPPTLSALINTSFPFSPSLSSTGNPHHSRWNFSCSFLLASFASLSFCRFNLVANHSSLAASCSYCVAWATMHLFMALFCGLHLKGAVNVRPRAHSAKTVVPHQAVSIQ